MGVAARVSIPAIMRVPIASMILFQFCPTIFVSSAAPAATATLPCPFWIAGSIRFRPGHPGERTGRAKLEAYAICL